MRCQLVFGSSSVDLSLLGPTVCIRAACEAGSELHCGFGLWLRAAAGLQCLGPPPSPTQLFSLGANRTCLQPTRISCPPHTWKQSAFLLSKTLLLGAPPPPPPPFPLLHQQHSLTFSPAAPFSIFEIPTCTTFP